MSASLRMDGVLHWSGAAGSWWRRGASSCPEPRRDGGAVCVRRAEGALRPSSAASHHRPVCVPPPRGALHQWGAGGALPRGTLGY